MVPDVKHISKLIELFCDLLVFGDWKKLLDLFLYLTSNIQDQEKLLEICERKDVEVTGYLIYLHLIKKLIHDENYDSALSVQRKQTFIWYKGDTLNYESNNIPRTQDIEPIYIETSGFYIFTKNHILEYGRRVGFNPYFQELNDIEAIDIDTKDDYEFALKIIANDNLILEV